MITTVAEIGINHNGNVENALKLIKIAAVAGFDYVKFQTRTPEICFTKEQQKKVVDSIFGRMTYLEYKKRLELNIEDYYRIEEACQLEGIKWFSSVWDIAAAKLMHEFCDTVKIASPCITDDGLLNYCRGAFKTRLLSTGMSTEEEIEKAVKLLDPHVIFHTVSSYPCKSEDLNLKYIKWLCKKYPDRIIGYSGHEEGLATTYVALVYGAQWFERHVTLDHAMPGSDQRVSVEPVGMLRLVRGLHEIEKSIQCGFEKRSVLECERESRRKLRFNDRPELA